MSAEVFRAAGVTFLWLAAGAYGVAVLERCIVAPGAGRAGVRVLLQPFASAVRLFRAPNNLPLRPDGALFGTAPVTALVIVAMTAWVIPFGPDSAAGNPSVGLFYFVVLLGPVVVALANAGWSTNGKYGLIASMRAISHIIAYEVVMGFAILGPAMAAESLSIVSIVEAQQTMWYGIWQPLGLVLYLASALFTIYRPPFDTPLTPEIAGGALAEYSGPRLLLFRAALAALLFVVSAAGAAIYLGGWQRPPLIGWLLPGAAWMLLKSFALAALLLWAGRHSPRFGHERMLTFSWKVILPLSFVNLAFVGILILVLNP